MKLILNRLNSDSLIGTMGELLLSPYDSFEDLTSHICYTLEPSPPLIHDGLQKISLEYSPKFHKYLPTFDVEGHSGVRLHGGNTIHDTTGCLLVGLYADKTQLKYSQPAVELVKNIIQCYHINQIKINNLWQK